VHQDNRVLADGHRKKDSKGFERKLKETDEKAEGQLCSADIVD